MAITNKLAYLNYEGLEKFWTKAKQYIDDKASSSNIIESVKIDGTALVINAKGVNFGLDYRSVDGKPSICLIDNNNKGAVVDSFDASEFIKDGFLQSVSYDSSTKKISFTWNTDAGVTVTPVDLSGLVDVYTGNGGIKVTGNVIQHTHSIAARSATTITAQSTAFGGKFNVLDVKYDAQGHITGHAVVQHTLPTLPIASTTVQGIIGLGYQENGKNYPLEASAGKGFVNVPWTDTLCTKAIINEGTATSPTTDTVEVIKEIADLTGTDGKTLQGTATRVNVVTVQGLNNALKVVQDTLKGHKSFSTVSVQGTSIAADGINDTLLITSGANVTLTADASNDSFTISAQDTKCTSLNFSPVALSTSGDTVSVVGNIPNTTGTGTGFTTSLQTVTVPTVQGVEKAIKGHHTFNTVSAQGTSIQADSAADTLTIVSGANVTITGDAINDKITISATNTAHNHNAGVGLVATGTGGVSGSVQYKAKLASETALTGNTVYSVGVDGSGNLAVSVPWTDNNTSHTHTSGPGIELTGTGGINGNTTITAKTSSADERGAVKVNSTLQSITNIIDFTDLNSYHTVIDICSADEKIYAKIPTITETEINALFD